MSSPQIPAEQQAWVLHQFGGSVHDYKLETIPTPKIEEGTPYDLLVQNYAISLNPTDEKARSGWYGKTGKLDQPHINGRDASGVVVALGPKAAESGLKVGDKVWYAGNTMRAGTYQQYTLVDSRIVGKKPAKWSDEEAASLPLTAITFWEPIKDDVHPRPGQKILIYGAAGGVGSIAIQLAKVWGLHVTATAGRPESVEWVKSLGADAVLDYKQPLKSQISDSEHFDICMNCHDESAWQQIVPVLKPRGKLIIILPIKAAGSAAPPESLPWQDLFYKRISIVHEMMFSRPVLGYEESEQGKLLNEVAHLADEGQIKPTNKNVWEWEDMIKAQELLVSGKTLGKNVIKVPH